MPKDWNKLFPSENGSEYFLCSIVSLDHHMQGKRTRIHITALWSAFLGTEFIVFLP
jgi:hypothetical protein